MPARVLALGEEPHHDRPATRSRQEREERSKGRRSVILRRQPVCRRRSRACARCLLWSLGDTRGLAPEGAFEAGRRLDAELGYGLGLSSAPGLLTPYAGVSLADGGERRLRTGARWNFMPGATLGLEASRGEAAEGAAPDHGVMLQAALRW